VDNVDRSDESAGGDVDLNHGFFGRTIAYSSMPLRNVETLQLEVLAW
jgi:hypothetical protein